MLWSSREALERKEHCCEQVLLRSVDVWALGLTSKRTIIRLRTLFGISEAKAPDIGLWSVRPMNR